MQKKYPPRTIIIVLLLLLANLAGCDNGYFDTIQKSQANDLLKVEIFFADNERLVGYIKSLEIEAEGKIYIGGSSVNYLYDRDGNIIGSYNYLRVLYIKIIDEAEQEEPEQE